MNARTWVTALGLLVAASPVAATAAQRSHRVAQRVTIHGTTSVRTAVSEWTMPNGCTVQMEDGYLFIDRCATASSGS
jgi:hypothetical protein